MEGVQIINFADLKKTDKKTKKKKEKVGKDENEEQQQIPDQTDNNQSQQPVEKETKQQEPEVSQAEFIHPFTYDQMLERITQILESTLAAPQKKFAVIPPHIAKMQGKRTQCSNFVTICEQLKRSPDHLCEFFLAELGTSGSVSEKSLILKGNFYIKSFESIISKYYNEFIKCPSCLSGNTDLDKDQQTRSFKLTCNQCKSSRYVKDIESGFSTIKRGQRRKERMK